MSQKSYTSEVKSSNRIELRSMRCEFRGNSGFPGMLGIFPRGEPLSQNTHIPEVQSLEFNRIHNGLARARLCLAKGGARFPRSENQNRRLRRAGGGGPFYTIWWNVSNPGMMFPYAGRVFLGIPGIHAEMWSPPPWRRGFLGGPGGRHAEMWNRGFGVDWLDSGGFGNAGGNRAPGQFRRWAPFAFKCCVGWTHKTLSPPPPL